MKLRHASLFAGIGGFDMAAEANGWENTFHVEWNPFGQHILKNNFKNTVSYGDITTVDFTPRRGKVDIISGGFPCQPYSTAGKRKGKDDERHLWPHMLRCIREVRPSWVVGENVRGLVSWSGGLVFEGVQSDLDAEGYDVQSFILPAASVGAPHRRERVWIVAHRSGLGLEEEGTEQFATRFTGVGVRGTVAHTAGEGYKERERNGRWQNAEENITGVEFRNERYGKNGITSDTCRFELQGGEQYGSTGGQREVEAYRGQLGGPVRTTWEEFPTVAPLRDGNDGLPFELVRQRLRDAGDGHLTEEEIDQILGQAYSRWCNETIKAGGNAIVPQVAMEIFGAINEYMDLYGKGY